MNFIQGDDEDYFGDEVSRERRVRIWRSINAELLS